eukprot:334900_1
MAITTPLAFCLINEDALRSRTMRPLCPSFLPAGGSCSRFDRFIVDSNTGVTGMKFKIESKGADTYTYTYTSTKSSLPLHRALHGSISRCDGGLIHSFSPLV